MIYRRAVIAGHNFCLNWIGNKFVLITAKMVVNMSLVWSANKIWSLSAAARIKHLKRGLLTFLSSTLKRKSFFFFCSKRKKKTFLCDDDKMESLSRSPKLYFFNDLFFVFAFVASIPFVLSFKGFATEAGSEKIVGYKLFNNWFLLINSYGLLNMFVKLSKKETDR